MFKKFTINLSMFNTKEYDITSYGAISGGQVSNTKAFAAAIDEATIKGGKVVVPDGIWLTGPIELKSNVELHLCDNAVILFDKNIEEYPLIDTDYEGIRRIRATSPIYANGACDIAITGNGVIDGSGHLWRPVKQFKMTERQWNKLLEKSQYILDDKEGGIWVPTKSIYDGRAYGEVFPDYEGALKEAAPYYDFYRPVMVSLKHCKRVLIEDVQLQNSPAWCLHPYFCEDLLVKNVKICNPYYAQNGDGIDIESCKNVEVAYCNFATGDDGICIKAGKDREARKIEGPCENIYIHHCYAGQGHGGFVIGSEMSRGVRNVLIEDCTFIDSDVGIRLKSALGRGGVVEDIYIKNINMVNIQQEAVIMTMNYVHNNMNYHEPVSQSEELDDIPEFRNIYLENCVCKGANRGIKIAGLDGKPHTIHDIHFKNCSFEADNENVLVNCENIYI
ncbi:MAG: glycoside hydrolase family 28 protein [Lachnospiraceae bacterium]|nr:glycoside hydrolase family 28 protein [Lachnospiraceae bacterium]